VASQSIIEDQALAVAFLTKVVNKEINGHKELCVHTADNVTNPIKNITNKFIGSRCRGLVDKPKIFFFLDDGFQRDVIYPAMEIDQDFGEVFVLNFILVVFNSN
jgi:hypothetical protein